MARRRASSRRRPPVKRAVKDIMTDYVETVRPNATVKEAAGRMRAFDIGSLPVCDAAGELVGIITDRDLVLRVTAASKNAASTPVGEVMSMEVVCCSRDQDLDDAVRIMQINQLRRLPVVDEECRLCGILTLADLARNGHEELAGKVLNAIVQPVQPVPTITWLR